VSQGKGADENAVIHPITNLMGIDQNNEMVL
jgi:hypothetical protein